MKLQKFRAGFGRIVTGISFVAILCLFAMVVVVTVDVVLRKVSGGSMRVDGSNELTQLLMVVVCSLGIPALQLKKGHIWVPLFVNKFPYRFRCFWLFVIMIVETAVIAMLAIGAYKKIVDLLSTGRASDVLRLPWWIFAVFILIAFIEYFVLSLIDTIQLCLDGVKNEKPKPENGAWSDDEVKGI
ncbi:MAG: TRAP transporter small permease subunit [Oscillospiraceae bacterium]|nr:TRAP transporter small permease subunit [Oscillospiraceae bacterium]